MLIEVKYSTSIFMFQTSTQQILHAYSYVYTPTERNRPTMKIQSPIKNHADEVYAI